MKMRDINKENRQKLALKREGHSLIDRIKGKGYYKDDIYRMLAKEMGVEQRHAHFASMQRLAELTKAVEALERLLKKLPKLVKLRGSVTTTTKTPIIRVKDQPRLMGVGVKKPKPPKESKVGRRLAQKKRDTLPHDQVLKALEEMRRDHEAGITFQGDYADDSKWELEVAPPVPKKTSILSWFLSFFHGKNSR